MILLEKHFLHNNLLAKGLKDIFRNTIIVIYLLGFFQQCLILVKNDVFERANQRAE